MQRSLSSSASLCSLSFPTNPTAYQLKDIIGYGSSSVVWRALCVVNDCEVAIKIIDLEACTVSIDQITKEIRTMQSCSHPNVVKYHCSFIAGHTIWLVMQYVSGELSPRIGSIQDIMRYHFRSGLDKESISGILSQVLSALNYLHHHNFIHRDIRSGNILIDKDGTVLLTDFGLSRLFTGTGPDDFIPLEGTLCWVAPEIINAKQYSRKSDIWSLGITALEIARGSAPYFNLPEIQAIMLIINNPSPTFDQTSEKEKYGKSLKELVDSCLQKEAMKRHSAEHLLKHRFFKNHPPRKEHLVSIVLGKLPPLPDRARALKIPEIASAQQRAFGFYSVNGASGLHNTRGLTLEQYYKSGMMLSTLQEPTLSPDEDDLWDFGTSAPGASQRDRTKPSAPYVYIRT